MRSFDAHLISADEVGEETGPAALVFDASGIDSPERLRALYDFFHPTIRSLRPNGRLLVLAGVVDEADGRPRPDRAAGARGLHPLRRQGDRQQGRRPPSSSGLSDGRREGDGVHPALPALGPLGVRRRPGDRDLQRRQPSDPPPRRLGPAPGRPDRRRHRRRPRHRRVDRRDDGARRRPRRLRRRPRRRRGPDRRLEPGRRRVPPARHHRRPTPASGSRPTSPSATGASTRSSTTRGSPATRRSAGWSPTSGTRCSRSTSPASSRSTPGSPRRG